MNESEALKIYVDFWLQIRRCRLEIVQLDFLSPEDKIFAESIGLPLGKKVLYFDLINMGFIDSVDAGEFGSDRNDTVLAKSLVVGDATLVYNNGSIFSYEIDEQFLIGEDGPQTRIRYTKKKILTRVRRAFMQQWAGHLPDSVRTKPGSSSWACSARAVRTPAIQRARSKGSSSHSGGVYAQSGKRSSVG